MSLENPPKALLTDVFGTVVDWRTTVVNYLTTTATATLNDPSVSISSDVRMAAAQISWPDFAQEWRNSYYKFTRSYNPDTMKFKTIDQHHLESLLDLVKKHGIEGLWQPDKLQRISLIWHFLDPWPGIAKLSQNLKVATLSNGGVTLLNDLASHGKLKYTHFFSSETFQAYKPHPSTYLGGCERLSLVPSECAMVAAHLNDLQAARSHGMQTIYIERKQEEGWDAEKINESRAWVDMWIKEDEGGFEEIARRLGID